MGTLKRRIIEESEPKEEPPMGATKDLLTTAYGGGDEAVAAAEKLAGLCRWIAVSEQWPEHLSDVLVTYKCGNYIRLGVGEFDGTVVNAEGITIPYFKGLGGFEVTHWMPLPEPPEVK
jgi:hypothetical protein